ncbi:DUF6891 domain-containing protein, partial [Streptomyces wuyuanensis]|uniref:DUF6891 domain-containing protein n=1 Tax=Streptomyces wuyuanensis TaxID=1196353 RepID=UPI003D723F26
PPPSVSPAVGCSRCRGRGRSGTGTAGAPDPRGFAHFHGQCTESAAAGHGLTLLYGGFDGSPRTPAAVRREVAAALAGVGCRPSGTGIPIWPSHDAAGLAQAPRG